MLRTLIWFTYFWIYLLIAMPLSGYITLLERKNQEKAYQFSRYFVKRWAKRLLRLAGAEVIVQGKENLPEDGAYLVVANHQGYFDIPIMLSEVGAVRGLVAKEEIRKIPGIRTWMRHLHCLFVNRNSLRAGAETIINGTKILNSGHGLTIFPEGTRSKGGAVKPFKAGAFRIAAQAGKPIVPVTIDGSYQLMEANSHMTIHPATVRVTIHPMIETKGLGREQIRALPEQVRETILSAM